MRSERARAGGAEASARMLLTTRLTNLLRCNFYTFYINGWVGQYEIMHKNGIITNLDLSKILKDESVNLRKFNKI